MIRCDYRQTLLFYVSKEHSIFLFYVTYIETVFSDDLLYGQSTRTISALSYAGSCHEKGTFSLAFISETPPLVIWVSGLGSDLKPNLFNRIFLINISYLLLLGLHRLLIISFTISVNSSMQMSLVVLILVIYFFISTVLNLISFCLDGEVCTDLLTKGGVTVTLFMACHVYP